jgi:hypothetical protein
MGQLSGFDAAIEVNEVAYSVKMYSITANVPGLDVSNTEGYTGKVGGTDAVGYTARVTGLKTAAIRLVQATYNEDDNLFGTPQDIRLGEYYSFSITPNRTGPEVFTMENGLVTSLSLDGDVEGLQPVSLEALSDGYFSFGNAPLA